MRAFRNARIKGNPVRLMLLLPFIAVLPVSAMEESSRSEDTAHLDKVEVSGRGLQLYRVNDSSIATRTNTPLEQVPQSVQVIPRELIEDQAARQITDLYRSVSGVSGFSYSGVTFRGFRQDEILYDGVRGDPFNGFSIPQLFNIDQVQVLKGTAGALYGSGEPGGLINYVTKKPTAYDVRRVEVQAGNYGYGAASAEFSGPLNGGKDWRYRAGIYHDFEDPFRYNTETENTILDLGLAHDFSTATTLTVQATHIEQRLQGARLRGVPTTDEGEFLTTIRWNHNEATDYQDLEATVLQARLDTQFGSNLAADFTLRWYENQELQEYHEPRALLDTDADGTPDYVTRQFRDQRRQNDAMSFTANFVTDFRTGDLRHTLLFGGDFFELDAHQDARYGEPVENGGVVPGLSLFDPDYGATSGADYGLDQIAYGVTASMTTRDGLYVQDQVEISDRWNVLLGLRHDGFDDENLQNGEMFDGSGMSWRVGSTYEIVEGVRGYAIYATGFKPQSVGNQKPEVGGPFDPEESLLKEIGAKTSLWNDRIGLNVALYEIERENILQPDPRGDVAGDGDDDMITVGRVRSRGFEVDVLADLTSQWVLNFTYGYNDTRIEEATGAITNAVGTRFANAPRHQAGLWTRYDFPSIRSAVAFGADHVSERFSLHGQTVQPYTVFDASWQTRVNDWLLQLNVKNLLDKEYAASGFTRHNGHFPGEPRRVYASATWQF